jgi:CubicO group peptidase (beta-lactamase class C family)
MLIVDLLRQTSGLTYGFQNRTPVDAAYRQLKLADIATSAAMVETLAALPLEFSPGEAWNYSVSTDVIGYLIGQISGQPFEDFLHSRLLDPLGMAETGFHVPTERADRLAACYTLSPLGVILFDDPAASSYLRPPSFISGGGGLVSTAAGYLKFCRMILGGGALDGRRYISPKTLELMAVNHLPGGADLATLSRSLFSEASYAGVGFGLGFAVTVDPPATLVPGTRGDLFWGGAASTYFWVDPAEDLAVVFLTQLLPSTAYPIRRELRTLVYSAFTQADG